MADIKIEKLLASLRDKSPLLLLGAGFSLGAVDGKKRPILSGRELANELFDNILSKASIDVAELSRLNHNRDNLKMVCDYLRDENLVEERNAYLVDRMQGCHCFKDGFHLKLKSYPWNYIFTLNIDDLVEKIYYDTELTVQVNGYFKQGVPGAPELIKLHGSVTKPECGFVFDSVEYRKFMATDNWLLTRFGTEYLKSDMIILGTEFQEEDLLLIIERFEKMSGATKDLNYFYITPHINNRSLRRKIEKNSNMHHIEFFSKDFMEFIVENVTSIGEHRDKIRDYGMIFLDEKKKERTVGYDDVAHLYLGEVPRYRYFFNDWDIRYPIYPEITEGESKLITIFGDPYVGKTCVAMRLLVNWLDKGFLACQFNMSFSLNAYSYSQLFIDYLTTLPAGSRVIMLSENSTLLYDSFRTIINHIPKNILQLIIVTTANREDHNSKRYILDRTPQWQEFFITEKIVRKYAENIFDKLDEKGHLNKLRHYDTTRNGIIKFIQSLDDIVDVLYVSQEGRNFVGYYSDWLNSQDEDIYRDAFVTLSFLSRINIHSIPIVIFSEIVQGLSYNFSYDVFETKYSEVIRTQDGTVRIRCGRLLNEVLHNRLGTDYILNTVVNLVLVLANNTSDREQTLKSELLQKVLKVKILLKAGFSGEEILQTLNRVKNYSKHLSYYWIQYGIVNRELFQFEEANNAFREAAGVRGHQSYQIQHAEAKNYMEWGIWELSNSRTQAPYYFEQGRVQMANLVNTAPHRYFSYSVHSYVDMVLRFYAKLGEAIPISEVNYMISQIITLLSTDRDEYSTAISRKFLSVCMRDCPETDLSQVQKLLDGLPSDKNIILDADLLDEDI